jgi:pimeloyl-ACP methyl ester carboxylesterase
MTGTKASTLDKFCHARGLSFLRFDYSGHGASGGDFLDGTISRWFADALAAFDRLTEGPQILVGSSMGGWIMLLLALATRTNQWSDRPGTRAGFHRRPDLAHIVG